jgi:hypothetical protein
VRQVDPRLEHLHLLSKPRVQLDHAGDLPQRDPGLPGVGGDHNDLGALHVIGEQPVRGEHGREGRLAVAARHRNQALARSRSSGREAPADDLFLPRPQPKRASGALPAGHGEVLTRERVHSSHTRPGKLGQVQRRRNLRLRSGLHASFTA